MVSAAKIHLQIVILDLIKEALPEQTEKEGHGLLLNEETLVDDPIHQTGQELDNNMLQQGQIDALGSLEDSRV